MKYFTTTIAAVLLSFAITGTANAGNINYNYVNLNYVNNDALGVSWTGFGIEGSFGVSDNMNVYLGYQNPSYSGLSISHTTIGVGYHQPIDANTDWYAKVDYRNGDALGSSISGFGASFGSRFKVDKFDLDAYFGYASYTNGATYSGAIYGIDGTYLVSDTVGITVGYMSDNDAFGWTGIKVGARMYF